MFYLDVRTKAGWLTEIFASYEEAQGRLESLPTEQLLGIPMIFEELADTSQRMVRADGKAIQMHRQFVTAEVPDDEPVPLVSELPEEAASWDHAKPMIRALEPGLGDEDLPPLPLADDPPPPRPEAKES